MNRTWLPIDSETPRGEFLLTRRNVGGNQPPIIISARQLPGTLGTYAVWIDAEGRTIRAPDDWMFIPT